MPPLLEAWLPGEVWSGWCRERTAKVILCCATLQSSGGNREGALMRHHGSLPAASEQRHKLPLSKETSPTQDHVTTNLFALWLLQYSRQQQRKLLASIRGAEDKPGWCPQQEVVNWPERGWGKEALKYGGDKEGCSKLSLVLGEVYF